VVHRIRSILDTSNDWYSDRGRGESVKAGRELDALVAEKVMGYKIGWLTEYGFKKEFERKVIALKGDRYDNIPRYSTNISDAWQVVEKVGKEFLVRKRLEGNDYRAFIITFDNYLGHKEYYAHAKTAPLAICLAALRAVGYEIEKAE
jgi:uncharacterized protein (DUF1330 family)